MSYLKLDDKAPEHTKILAVGPLGFALWTAGLAFCNRNQTDGFIPLSASKLLMDVEGFSFDGVPVTMRGLIKRLVEVKLWEECDGGYMVHDYLRHQQSKEQIEVIREARATAGAKGGSSKAPLNRKQNASNLLDVSQAKPKQNASKTPSTLKKEEERNKNQEERKEEEKKQEEITPPSRAPGVKITPSPFDYPQLWRLIETQQGRKLTWSFPAETKAVKTLLTVYPHASPADLAAFLVYKATCYGIDPNSQPSFTKYKGDFGAWYNGGMPLKQEQKNDIGSATGKGYNGPNGSPKDDAIARSITATVGRQQDRLARGGDQKEPPIGRSSPA